MSMFLCFLSLGYAQENAEVETPAVIVDFGEATNTDDDASVDAGDDLSVDADDDLSVDADFELVAQEADLLNLELGNQEINALRQELGEVRDELGLMQAVVTLLQSALKRDLSDAEIKTIEKKQSKDIAQIMLRFQDRINYIEEQTSQITGQIEELQFKIVPLEESLAKLEEAYAYFTRKSDGKQENLRELLLEQTQILTAQQTTIKTQGLAIKKLEKNNNQFVKALKDLSGKVNKTSKSNQKKQVKVPTASELFTESLKLLNNDKNYPKSRAKFREFLRRYPKRDLAFKVPYWIGESYYLERDYVNASQNFLESYQKYPQGEKAADSLVKLGVSLLKLQQIEGGCSALQEVKIKFPKARPSLLKRAQSEYDQAKCDQS